MELEWKECSKEAVVRNQEMTSGSRRWWEKKRLARWRPEDPNIAVGMQEMADILL